MPDFMLDGLTEEQQTALQAEIDRRVTSAVQTTTKKVTETLTNELTEKYQKEYETKMQEAVANAQAQATMTEEQKIKALSDQLAEQQKQFEKAQMLYTAERKLRDAGLADEAIQQLAPLIVAGADQTSIDSHLDAFVQTQQSAVEAALQAQKEQLALNVTPPASTGGNVPPSNPEAVAHDIINQDGADPRFAQAQAIDYLINATNDAAGL